MDVTRKNRTRPIAIFEHRHGFCYNIVVMRTVAKMDFRQSQIEDMDQIVRIAEDAKAFLRADGVGYELILK